MSTMADLMASPDVGLPEDTVKVCLAGKLAPEITAADAKMFELEEAVIVLEDRIADLEQQSKENPEAAGKRRMAAKPEVVKLRKELEAAREAVAVQAEVVDEIRERMSTATIIVTLRGKNIGAWRAFCSDHPPRDKEEDRAGFVRDLRLTMQACNVDDLAAAVGDFAVKYGDEEATPEFGTFLVANAIPGDLDRAAKTIARLHEGGLDLGKSRRDWLEARRSEADSK